MDKYEIIISPVYVEKVTRVKQTLERDLPAQAFHQAWDCILCHEPGFAITELIGTLSMEKSALMHFGTGWITGIVAPRDGWGSYQAEFYRISDRRLRAILINYLDLDKLAYTNILDGLKSIYGIRIREVDNGQTERHTQSNRGS